MVKIVIPAIIATVTLFGCSKKKVTQFAVTVTTWTVDGITYTSSATTFINGDLTAMDGNRITLPRIYIHFDTPVATTVTAVNALENDSSIPGQCLIGTSNSGGNLLYSNGGTVTTTISNEKIIATFINIPMVKQAGTAATLLQQEHLAAQS